MKKPKSLFYTLGLDIGIGSVGWAVVENRIDLKTKNLVPFRLIGTGVRIFPPAENPKNGGSLAQDRREARSTRKRLKRRKQRLKDIKRLLQEYKFISKYSDIDSTINYNPYDLRVKALDNLLTDLEFTKVILHIAKRRGFKSNRKDMNLEKDGGVYKKFIEENKKRIEDQGYRTVGEMLAMSNDFASVKRNRNGEYRAMVTRDMLEYELELIMERQNQLGNAKITKKFRIELLNILLHQRPFASGEAIKALVGKCTFEDGEIRASKYSYSFELFTLLQKISNTMLYSRTLKEELSIDNKVKEHIVNLALSKQKIYYKDLRKLLELPNDVIFSKYRFKRPNSDKNWEDDVFFEMKGYHSLKKAFKKSEHWDKLSDNHEIMDVILQALTLYKTDEDITSELKRHGVGEAVIAKVLTMPHFSKFGHLSLKALGNLIPLLYEKRYDQAWREAYPNANEVGDKRLMLAKIPEDEIRNPVVLRALTQMRRVVNAIIMKYGSPSFIHIELGRDMSKSYKERKELEKSMEENYARKEQIKKELQECGVENPSNDLVFRYGLWKSQKNECAYSNRKISFEELTTSNRTQVDHILPMSRSLNDSYDNKVLVFVEENQRKGNRTPLEYLVQDYGETSDRVRRYKLWVDSLEVSRNGISPRKKENLLNTDLSELKLDEYIERDLNDTRYIARYAHSLLRDRLMFNPLPSELSHKVRRVYSFPGFFTARMRFNYGISKDRSETNRHHAMDAIILATSNPSMMKAVADFYKIKEAGKRVDDNDAPKYLEPWKSFKLDVQTRVYGTDFSIYENNKELLTLYQDGNVHLQPMFVSWMETRKVTGPAHEATLYSPKQIEKGKISYKKRDTKTKNIEIVEKKPSGFMIGDKTYVQNASMVRVDVYTKNKKYFLVPVYVADVQKKAFVSKAVVPGKNEKHWTIIDSSFSFEFSIHQNDYVRIINSKNKEFEGYFQKFNKSSGVINLLNHDQVDKDSKITPTGCSSLKIALIKVPILGY